MKVHTVTSGQTFGADEELLSQVKSRVQLTVTHWLESSIIIVFCPITSRVGSDVEAAMNLMTGNGFIYVFRQLFNQEIKLLRFTLF